MGAQATRFAVPELKNPTQCKTDLALDKMPDKMPAWMLDCMHDQLQIDKANADKTKADKAKADEVHPDELEAVKSKAPLGPENLAVHTQAFAVVLPAGELESSGHAAHVDTLLAPTTPVAENLPSGQSKHAAVDKEVPPNVVE